jgi:geranylgeranyl reductase family protein
VPDAPFSHEHDAEAIVVGGGPAGSALATRLADAGHRVLLLDKARFPRRKACSEYVNPGAVALLGDLGVLDDVLGAGADRMDAMVVHAPNGSRFAVNFARAEPGRAALGLSRYRLDHILLERAKSAGVTVIERAHVRRLIHQGGHVTGVDATVNGSRETIRAPIVIGADGHNSVVSRELGLDVTYRWPRKTGFIAHYRGVTGLDRSGEMHVGRDAYAGLAMLEDGLTNVAVVADARDVEARPGSVEAFFAASLASIPAVARKLEGAEREGGIRGVGSMARRARRTVGDGYLLVGDAASFLDPFTGEGIYEALKGAELAAPVVSAALKSGDTSARALDSYRMARRQTFTAKRQVCWIVQGFINVPPAMNYVTQRLSTREDIGLTLTGVLGDFRPATAALSPIFLARLLRP